MKAYVLRDNGRFGIEEVAQPVPGQGEVLVRVMAAGICGSDISRIYYHGAYSYPLIPGHEYSGIVVGAGDDAEKSGNGDQRDPCSGIVTDAGDDAAASDDACVRTDPCKAGGGLGSGQAASWIGKRVGIFPLIPCGKCLPCRQKKYEMCRHYSYLGSRRDGGFAEYVSVPVWNLVELPEKVTFEQAAMLEPMAVAAHAMRRALQENTAHGAGTENHTRIAICGLGTIGLFLLMFLKEAGYGDILVIGNKDVQREKALALGVSEGQFYDRRNGGADAWLEECTQEKAIDVFFECVGSNETIDLAVNYAAPGGRVMLVGNPASDMVLGRQTYWKILRNQLTLLGTWNSSYHGTFGFKSNAHRTAVSSQADDESFSGSGTASDDELLSDNGTAFDDESLFDSGMISDEAVSDEGQIPEDDWQYVLKRLAEGRVHPEWMITHRYGFDEFFGGFELMRDKTEEYLKVMMRFESGSISAESTCIKRDDLV